MRKLLTFSIASAVAVSIAASAFAGWQSRDSNYNIAIVSGGGGSFTTFDPATAGNFQTLSNGNLTDTGTSTNGIVRTIASHSSGTFYNEFTVGSATNSAAGYCASTTNLNSFIDADNTSYGAFQSGNWFGNSGGVATAPSWVAGHVYGMAVDIGNKKGWIKDITAGGLWNVNGTADPAANINGSGFPAGLTGAIFFCVGMNANGDNITANFGATSYVGTPPSGFGNW